MKKRLENFFQTTKKKAESAVEGISTIKDMYKQNEFGTMKNNFRNGVFLATFPLSLNAANAENINSHGFGHKEKSEKHQKNQLEKTSQAEQHNSIGFNQARSEMSNNLGSIFGDDDEKEINTVSFSGKPVAKEKIQKSITSLYNREYLTYINNEEELRFAPTGERDSLKLIDFNTNAKGKVTSIDPQMAYKLERLKFDDGSVPNRAYLIQESFRSPFNISVSETNEEKNDDVVTESDVNYKIPTLTTNFRTLTSKGGKRKIKDAYMPYIDGETSEDRIDMSAIRKGGQLPFLLINPAEKESESSGTKAGKGYVQGTEIYKLIKTEDSDLSNWEIGTCGQGDENGVQNSKRVGETFNPCYRINYWDDIEDETGSKLGNPGHLDSLKEVERNTGDLESKLMIGLEKQIPENRSAIKGKNDYNIEISPQFMMIGNKEGGSLWAGPVVEHTNTKMIYSENLSINDPISDIEGTSLSRDVTGGVDIKYELVPQKLDKNIPLHKAGIGISYQNGAFSADLDYTIGSVKKNEEVSEDYTIIFRDENNNPIKKEKFDKTTEYQAEGTSHNLELGVRGNLGKIFGSENYFMNGLELGLGLEATQIKGNTDREYQLEDKNRMPNPGKDNTIYSPNINVTYKFGGRE